MATKVVTPEAAARLVNVNRELRSLMNICNSLASAGRNVQGLNLPAETQLVIASQGVQTIREQLDRVDAACTGKLEEAKTP